MVKIILVIHVSIIVTVHVQQLRAKHRYREEKLLRYFDMDEILWCDHSLVAMVRRSVAWWRKKTAARETKQTAVEENNKKIAWLICSTFLCIITLRNKMVAPAFLPLFDMLWDVQNNIKHLQVTFLRCRWILGLILYGTSRHTQRAHLFLTLWLFWPAENKVKNSPGKLAITIQQ